VTHHQLSISKNLEQVEKSTHVLLIALPWPRLENVSIQLGTLKAYLKANNINVAARYYYKDIRDFIGEKALDLIVKHDLQQYGFAALLFPRKRKNIEAFFKKILPTTFDFNKYLVSLREYATAVVDDILKVSPKLVGFTTTFFQLIPSIYVAKEIKKENSDIKVVFGGANLNRKFAIGCLELFDCIDYIIIGEGEQTLLELACAIKDPTLKLGNILGLVYREGRKIKVTPRRPLIKNLDMLPVPDFSEYFSHTVGHSKPPYPKIIIEASRGCFYGNCLFCNLNCQWNNSYRQKSDEKVIEEIKHQVRRYKTLSFMFCDTNISNRKRLFEKIAQLDMDLEIYAEVSGHGVTKPFFETLKVAGIRQIQIGTEALSNNLLRLLNKGVDVMRNVEMLKWCAEYGIDVYYNLMYDIPGESEEDIEITIKTIQFVKYFQPPARLCSFIVGYGCPAHKNPEKYGIKKLKIANEYVWNYPMKVIRKIGPLLSPIVGYEPLPKPDSKKWDLVLNEIRDWKNLYEANGKKPGLVYSEGDNFILLTLRNGDSEKHMRIEGFPAQLYKACLDERQSLEILSNRFECDKKHIKKILDIFVNKKLMFRSNEEYFALAVPVKSLNMI
jgi:ribosomal peptide maturation radical SAM protein 1